MKLTVTGQDDFATRLAADASALRSAAAASVEQAAKGLQADLRAQVIGAGLGHRLANTWRVAYRAGQRQALVYTKAPHIIRGHDQGAVIKSGNGFPVTMKDDRRGGQRPIVINMNVNATDAGSFRRSEAQIGAEIAARLQQHLRRNG